MSSYTGDYILRSAVEEPERCPVALRIYTADLETHMDFDRRNAGELLDFIRYVVLRDARGCQCGSCLAVKGSGE